MYVCKCMYEYAWVYIMCVRLRATALRTRSCSSNQNKRSGPDPNSCSLWTQYTSESKTDPWMIQGLVPVRAVKTRRQFRPKTVSFHISVCFCIISLFIVVSSICMLLVSFHVTIWIILPVCLCVLLHGH